MISPENIGQQFLLLYRGLNTTDYEGGRYPVNGVDDADKGLGVHWTDSIESAKRFSVGMHPDENYLEDEEGAMGHVVEAHVPLSSVNHEAGDDYNLGSENEREVPLLYNAPITVVGVHETEANPSTKQISIKKNSINPPLQRRT